MFPIGKTQTPESLGQITHLYRSEIWDRYPSKIYRTNNSRILLLTIKETHDKMLVGKNDGSIFLEIMDQHV